MLPPAILIERENFFIFSEGADRERRSDHRSDCPGGQPGRGSLSEGGGRSSVPRNQAIRERGYGYSMRRSRIQEVGNIQFYSLELGAAKGLNVALGIGENPGVKRRRGVVQFSNPLTIQDTVKGKSVNGIELQWKH